MQPVQGETSCLVRQVAYNYRSGARNIGGSIRASANERPAPAGAFSAGAPNTRAEFVQAAAYVKGDSIFSAIGFKTVTHPGVGLYCLTLPAAVRAGWIAQVTVEWNRSLGVALFAMWDIGNVNCPQTARTVSVRTYKGDTGGVGSALQTPVLSNDIAFVVIVP